jgi:hypothetical protein
LTVIQADVRTLHLQDREAGQAGTDQGGQVGIHFPGRPARPRAGAGRLGSGAVLAEARAAWPAALFDDQRPFGSHPNRADLSRAVQEAPLHRADERLVRMAEERRKDQEAFPLPAQGPAIRLRRPASTSCSDSKLCLALIVLL